MINVSSNRQPFLCSVRHFYVYVLDHNGNGARTFRIDNNSSPPPLEDSAAMTMSMTMINFTRAPSGLKVDAASRHRRLL